MEELRIEEMKEEFNSEYHKGDFAEPPFYSDADERMIYEEPIHMEKKSEERQNAELEIRQEKTRATLSEEKKEEKKNAEEDIIYHLKKPIHFEGEYIDRVRLDFESLTGRDLKQAARDKNTAGSSVVEYDKGYLANVACLAMGKPYEFMDYVGAKDFTEITASALAFFLL